MPDYLEKIKCYLSDLRKVLDKIPLLELEEIILVLEKAKNDQATVFICGNGGSWATAAHMVCDFGKNTQVAGSTRMNVIGLGDNIPTLTAYANDEGYERVFAEPVISLMKPADVLIAISGSGNSPNVLRAVEAANQIDCITIGLTGFDGGQLKGLADFSLVIPSDSMEIVEDCHMIVDHLLTICLRQ